MLLELRAQRLGYCKLLGVEGWHFEWALIRTIQCLATSLENPNMLLSGSRDKTLIIWNLTRDETSYGVPKRSMKGHSHIISDCVRILPRIHDPSVRYTNESPNR